MRKLSLAIAVLAAACAARPGPPSPREPAAPSAPSLAPGPPAQPTPLGSDPLWQRAGRGDPIDLAALADRAGAAELLDAVALGGSLALTALSALPYAGDAEIALGPLCELAARTPRERLGPVLTAIDGILTAPRPTDGAARRERPPACRSVLGSLQPLAPAERDRVAASRALLEEWLAPR